MADMLIDDDYNPVDDDTFMSERQLEYFRRRLLDWRNQLLRESDDAIGSDAKRNQQFERGSNVSLGS